MATRNRYYITCDDDHAVVRTIPVSIRRDDTSVELPAHHDAAESTPPRQETSARVARLVRSAIRHSPHGR